MPKGLEFVKNLDKIIILAQGPSWYQCPYAEGETPEGTEIWGSNVIWRDHRIDRIFFGHDPRYAFLDDDFDVFNNMNKLGFPIYVNGVFKPLKNSVLIPVREILEEFKIGFFLNVIAWMLATAILQKPKTIDFYGVDMRPDAGGETYANEKGSVEFWCGVANGRGIPIENTKESYVMKSKQEGNFPGYKPKVLQKGLYSLLPEQDRNLMGIKQYAVMPVGDEY